MHTILKILGLGIVANAVIAVPYYNFVEKKAIEEMSPDDPQYANPKKALASARTGTIALCVIPWLYTALHAPIIVGGTVMAIRDRVKKG